MTTTRDVIAALETWSQTPDNETLTDTTTHTLIEALIERQIDQEACCELEYECSTSIALARGYFDVLDSFLSKAPSRVKDDGWVKTSGFAINFDSTKAYAPLIELSAPERTTIRKLLQEGTPGVVVNLSRFGLVLPYDVYDLPPMATILALEQSIVARTHPRPMPKLEAEGPAQLLVAGHIVLPWEAGSGIRSWEQFDEEVAMDIENRCVGEHVQVNARALSLKTGVLICGERLLFELGNTLLRPLDTSFDDAIIRILNDAPRKAPRIEYVLVPGAQLPFERTRSSSLSVRLLDGHKLLGEVDLLDTTSPAFIVGYLSTLVDEILRPGCEMRVVDLRAEPD